MDEENGERARPARGVWRPARHTFPRDTPSGLATLARIESSKGESGKQRGSAARDAPHCDRDGRAPQTKYPA